MRKIEFFGVEQNNLKNIDFSIPLKSFTVICGPSGSGKSSLAFETLYAEGQRRYIESLSNYSKQFFAQLKKPAIQSALNLPPAIALEQKNTVHSSRSNVGSATEILDYLRMIYEKSGEQKCPEHKINLEKHSPDSATNDILKNFSGEKAYFVCSIKLDLKKRKQLIDKLIQDGYERVLDEKNFQVEQLKTYSTKYKKKTDFLILIDRLLIDQKDKIRIKNSIRSAFSFNKRYFYQKSLMMKVYTLSKKTKIYSDYLICPKCFFVGEKLTSQHLNFNSPLGNCTDCKGFGNILKVDPKKVIKDPNLSIKQGAIKVFQFSVTKKHNKSLNEMIRREKISTKLPWKKLKKKHQQMIWEGKGAFPGVTGLFKLLERKRHKAHIAVFLSRNKSPFLCNACKGTRLKAIAENVFFKSKSINELSRMSFLDLLKWFESIKLNNYEKTVIKELYEHILSFLKMMNYLGLSYLNLSRETKTLSGGEYQRMNIVKQLSGKLSQSLYVLDEPTVGLHPKDSFCLIQILLDIQKLGNTLVVVEHDLDMIKNSDYIIEMGPGSGTKGGKVVFSGSYKNFLKAEKSQTACYLEKRQIREISNLKKTNMKTHKYKLLLTDCSGHNLKNIKLQIPLNRFTTITGVSGSGKSSLICQTLYPALKNTLENTQDQTLKFKSLKGSEYLTQVHFIDQSPLSVFSRSIPATYLSFFKEIRELFAQNGSFTPSHFSLNTGKGRCPDCLGLGYKQIDMIFMDDIEVICDACKGLKFKKEVLESLYRGKSISDVLNMSVEEAFDFFFHHSKIIRVLSVLKQMGLEYLQIGQVTSSLSGGEIQRLKIAKQLLSTQNTKSLFIMDEPTRGLHFKEVYYLIKVVRKLIEAGNSVLMIEHNQEIILNSDYLIDLGPEGGNKGGKIVFEGDLTSLLNSKKSVTGKYLNEYLNRLK